MSTKVLVIDDAIHIRRLIARMLEQADFTIIEASNGSQGFELIRQHKPHIVTCDISMPFMDGFQFLSKVKADPDLRNIPVIIVTAIGQEEETTKATELGADACLTKPFSSSRLLDLVQTLLAPRSGPNTPGVCA